MEGENVEADHQPHRLGVVVSMDDIVEKSLEHLNWTQILQAIIASLPSFFDSQQTYISNFVHAQPKWHCTTTSATSCVSNNSNMCNLSRNEWAWDAPRNTYTSIISEWDLECATSFITGFPTTCYFIGCLLGGLLLATLGDSSLGRKNLLCISSLVMSLAALASAFSPNLWVYSGFRFLSGAGRAPVAICTVVLLTERVSKGWRSQIAMVGFSQISLGILALTGIAYLSQGSSWRTMYLWTSIPGIISSILCYFFLFESPRWLFTKERSIESMTILKKLGSITPIGLANLGTQLKAPKDGDTSTSISTSTFSALKILVKKRWAIQRLLASMFLAFGIGLMYFGMFLGVGSFRFNIYLTSTLSALLLLASHLLTFLFWIQRCNRRTSLLGFCTISGVTSIIFSILGNSNKNDYEGIYIGLELISLFCASMAYSLMLMYTVELFPTCVRHSASSLVRQAMILGSVFDPVLILIGRENMVYSYGVFGVTVLLCGFLVLCLPETRGKVLCDTMEEQELMDANSSKFII